MPPHPLADGWDSNAHDWIAWTRTGVDSYESHRDSFLPLIPAPGRLTVDVGSGEGRVSRELQALGHRVLAIDRSLTMSRSAAAHPVEPVPAIVHPINSAGHFPGDRDDATRPFVIDESYLRPKHYVTTRAREGLTMTYHGEHRPLQAYTDALSDAGFVIDRLREQAHADTRDKWHRIPLFLHIVASLHPRG